MDPQTDIIITFSWNTTHVETKDYRIKAWADSSEIITEVVEDNNWCDNGLSIFIYEPSVRITLFIPLTKYCTTENIPFSGSISSGIVGAGVTITYTMDDKVKVITVTTGPQGMFTGFITDLKTNDMEGIWECIASWNGISSPPERFEVDVCGMFTDIPGFPVISVIAGLILGLLLIWNRISR